MIIVDPNENPRIPGTDVGVVGGIPTNRPSGSGTTIDVTQSPYNADNTGATDAGAAINSAWTAAAAGSVIYCPAGTYKITTGLRFLANNDQKTLRGAGDTTIFDSHVDTCISVTNGDNWTTPINVTAGISKGSTQFTVASTTGFVAGQMMRIAIANDTALPTMNVKGYDYNNQQRVLITSVDSTHINFYPALYDNFGSGARNVTVSVGENQFHVKLTGIEDLYIDGTSYYTEHGNTGPFSAITVAAAWNCWIKGVHTKQISNYPIYFADTCHCELRRCYIEGLTYLGTNNSGLLLNNSSATLIEDNIFLAFWEVNQSTGCVLSRNYQASGIDSNHNSGTGWNLYEGNEVLLDFKQDGYFGSAQNDTVFRNAITQTTSLKRFSRNYAMIGNFLNPSVIDDVRTKIQFGLPNIGNLGFTGTAHFPDDPWIDYGMTGTLTTRSSDTGGIVTYNTSVGSVVTGFDYVSMVWATGRRLDMHVTNVSGLAVTLSSIIAHGDVFPSVSTAVSLYHSSNGYQEKDLVVEETTILLGNRYSDDYSFDSLGGDTMPDSFIYDSKPQWLLDAEVELDATFNLAPYTPETDNTPSEGAIPAAVRYGQTPSPPEVSMQFSRFIMP